MDEANSGWLSKLLRSPEDQLRFLRMLFAPVAGMAGVLYVPLMFGAMMASDSGTDLAIRYSTLLLFGFTFYLIAVFIAFVKWADWPLISAFLLSAILIANTVALALIPKTAVVIPSIAIGFFGIDIADTYQTIAGSILFAVFLIIVPVLSVWRLIRHGFDMDFPGPDGSVELWDLKSMNK